MIGRDLFAAAAHGARTSLLVVGAVALMTLALGIPVGLVAGYHGGRTDQILMRAAELVQVVPRFFLAVDEPRLPGQIAATVPGLDLGADAVNDLLDPRRALRRHASTVPGPGRGPA
jgi:hypothetical protein